MDFVSEASSDTLRISEWSEGSLFAQAFGQVWVFSELIRFLVVRTHEWIWKYNSSMDLSNRAFRSQQPHFLGTSFWFKTYIPDSIIKGSGRF